MPAPLIVETDLKEILTEINQKLGTLQKDVTDLKVSNARIEGDVQTLDEKLTGQIQTLDEKLTGEVKTLDEKVNGIGKRLDTQEFINRSVVVGVILSLVVGLVKLFYPGFPNS